MGNCINRYASHPPAGEITEYASPGSMPDVTPGEIPAPHSSERPRSPQLQSRLNQFPRFTALPKEEQTSVSRFLDVPSLKNVRLSGKDGAALSKSWWVGNADELARVLEKFNPQRIEGLTLDGCDFTDAHMQMLPPTLTRLKFSNQTLQPQITEAGFAHLRGMRLRHLDLRGFSGMNDACMAHLRGMPLETIYFCPENGVTDSGLMHLQGMPLRYVSLPENHEITDSGVACISMRFMDSLNLRGCKKITDATPAHWSDSPLRQLDLSFGPEITDEGIKHLRSSALQYLGLDESDDVTSACFDDLCAMPRLKRLAMCYCPQIPGEEMDALRARLLQKNPAFTFGAYF